MTGHHYDESEVEELVAAAREAAEELYIVTRMGSRRSDPIKRWQRLVDPLKPFAITEGGEKRN